MGHGGGGIPGSGFGADAEGKDVQLNTSFLSTYKYTSKVEVRNFEVTYWFIEIDDNGSVTAINMKIQSSDKENPTVDDDWYEVQTESINSGIATLSDYVLEKSVSGATNFMLALDVRGRWMRMAVKIKTGSPSGSYNIRVYRR